MTVLVKTIIHITVVINLSIVLWSLQWVIFIKDMLCMLIDTYNKYDPGGNVNFEKLDLNKVLQGQGVFLNGPFICVLQRQWSPAVLARPPPYTTVIHANTGLSWAHWDHQWRWEDWYNTRLGATLTLKIWKISWPSQVIPDNKVPGANMGSTWDLSAPDTPHLGPMNLAISDVI